MAEAVTADGEEPAAAPSGTLSESLAGFWAGAPFERMPASAVVLAKRFLLDLLGAGLAGARTEVADVAVSAARAGGECEAGSAVVWGRSETLPAPLAALVNGTSAHALELDDFGGCGHSGAVVVPVILALAGRGGVSGKQLLVAMLAGFDVAARVLEGAGGYRPHNHLGWHSTGTCGTFGAAASAARLLDLDKERFADALGIAGTYTGGIWAFLDDGAMTKRFHPGKAAETGLSAALLARAGMSGPRRIFEAEWGGFFTTYSRGIATPAALTRDLGREILITRSGMKPYACCRGLHADIDALLDVLKETGRGSRDIRRIVVHGDAQYCRQFDRREPKNLLDAQFSLPYALAVTAVSGRATLDQFWPIRQEAEVQRIIAATELRADRTLKTGEYPPIDVEFEDGRTVSRHVAFARGAPENPLPDEEVEAKFASLAGPVLGESRRRQIAALVAGLEDVSDARALIGLLAIRGRDGAA